MKVFKFKIKSGQYGCGEAIVAANDKEEAWNVLEKSLDWESEHFNKESCSEILSLTSLINKPTLITYVCYIE